MARPKKIVASEAPVTPSVEATNVVEAEPVDLHAVPDEPYSNDVVVQHVNGSVTMTLFCANVAVHFENGLAHVTSDVAYLLRKGGHVE